MAFFKCCAVQERRLIEHQKNAFSRPHISILWLVCIYNNSVASSKQQPHTTVHVAAIAGIPRCLKCVVEASENSNFAVDLYGKLRSSHFGTHAFH